MIDKFHIDYYNELMNVCNDIQHDYKKLNNNNLCIDETVNLKILSFDDIDHIIIIHMYDIINITIRYIGANVGNYHITICNERNNVTYLNISINENYFTNDNTTLKNIYTALIDKIINFVNSIIDNC